jgi:DUF1680 family protein
VLSLDLRDVTIEDDFWSPRVDLVRRQTLPFQYEQLQTTGRLAALRLGWRTGDPDRPHIFWDSDVAKWIEAASYSLATSPDPELAARVDEAVALLDAAQQPNGYLNTYFTVVEPGRRWTDLRDAHELYCAGHLIEAGVAHYEATGKTTLLDTVRRFADHIASVFGPGPGQRRGYPGHEEIELALVKLYRVTAEKRYLQLAAYFIDERGREPFYFEQEAADRETPGYFSDHFPDRERRPEFYRRYNQSHLPVREQTEAVGHSVRAMYLYSAMADVAAETGDASLVRACERLWRNVTDRRMYVTGGIGSTASIEGFGSDYHLPNESAYAETCAAIGLVFWMQRMTLLTRDGRYADTLERALYNGVLSGISLDGRKFFYENPLASRGDRHRQEWFGVACCPPNLARLLSSLGRYIYARGDQELAVNLYVGGSAALDLAGERIRIEQRTTYPWVGDVRITVRAGRPAQFVLALRIPGWCTAVDLDVNGDPVQVASALDRGYIRLRRGWRDGDEVQLRLSMPARRIWAHPAVADDAGLVALSRGPLVYCVEEADLAGVPHQYAVPRDAPVTTEPAHGLPGVLALSLTGDRAADPGSQDDPLYESSPPKSGPGRITAVPYFAWDNRSPGAMRVWMRESPSTADPQR